jgi:hypothetical protein
MTDTDRHAPFAYVYDLADGTWVPKIDPDDDGGRADG